MRILNGADVVALINFAQMLDAQGRVGENLGKMKSAQYHILVLHSLRIRFVTELYHTTTVFNLQKYHPDPDPHINILSIDEIDEFSFDINQWEARR